MLGKLRRLFWCWVPHACTYRGATRTDSDGQVTYGATCQRCGTAIWFNVKG